MVYRVVLALDGSTPVDYKIAVPVTESNHRQAACRALAEIPADHPARDLFRRGGDVYAWAWTEDAPKHPNGAPMVVHGLTLRKGAPAPVPV